MYCWRVKEWLLEYDYDINFIGSFLVMEVEGVVVLRGRLIGCYIFRYNWMVSDEDSMEFNCIEYIYGKIGLYGV